jgi:hypothetical protein
MRTSRTSSPTSNMTSNELRSFWVSMSELCLYVHVNALFCLCTSHFRFPLHVSPPSLEPVHVGTNDLINNSSKLQELLPELTNTYGQSRVVSWDQTFIASVDFQVQTRLPVVVDGLLGVGFSSLTSFGAFYTNRLEEEVALKMGIFVPPYTSLGVTLELLLGRVNAPFVGTLKRTYSLRGVHKRVLTYRVPGIFKEAMVHKMHARVGNESKLPVIFNPDSTVPTAPFIPIDEPTPDPDPTGNV